MFSPKDGSSRSMLIRGPPELTKPFVFEAAIHWAEKGHRVIYITPRPLQSLPATYHDRSELSPGAFKLVRFMYLEDYESLIDQLVDLHNFQVVPSVLLMDDLDAYMEASPCSRTRGGRSEIRTDALLALVSDTINACSRVLNGPVNLLCAGSSLPAGSGAYFREVWQLSLPPSASSVEGASLCPRLSRIDNANDSTIAKIFDYRYSTDGTLALRRISVTRVREPSKTRV